MASRLYQEGSALTNYACSEQKVEKCGTCTMYLISLLPHFVYHKQPTEAV